MAEDPQRSSSQESRPIPWKLVLWGAAVLYAVIFLLVNSDRQDVDFVFFTVKTRQIWLILLSMALGAVVGRIGPRWWRNRDKR